MTLPSLTTVAQPFTKIGKTGGDMLIGMIEGKNDKDAEGRILPHRIVERRSVCMKVSAS
jgi:DNA-binding LacI/PurR family transcriptional regulator